MMQRATLTAVGLASLATTFLTPVRASAHGLSTRADLPIPVWLFSWAAAAVLVVSFVALAAFWSKPKLEEENWRALPTGVGRLLASRTVEIACGAIGVLLLLLTRVSGLLGNQAPRSNFAPTFVYVIFWVGLVLASVVFGDIFRAFNPWRAVGRAIEWATGRHSRDLDSPRRTYPTGLGHWPAAAGILAFAWLEIVLPRGERPENVAIAACVYSLATFIGMAKYGVNAWIERAEAFAVYFNLFSRISPFERRGDEFGLRRPLSGLAGLSPQPGTVALVATIVGTVTFDGASEGRRWSGIASPLTGRLEAGGVSPTLALTLVSTAGMLLAVLLVYGFYTLAVAGAQRMGGDFTVERLARAFVHSLVPIALVYVAAHYFTLLMFQGQAIFPLLSDPLGSGATAMSSTYSGPGAYAIWYIQVTLVVIGHVVALALAHDRAIALYDDSRLAVRSQYWMLGVMIGFTTLALWLLSQANA
jgi:hypothetical protein